MEIKLSQLEEPTINAEVWRILCECDQEFVPPLSTRNSSIDRSFDAVSSEIQPHIYFKEMGNQVLLTSHNGERITGFMSFRHNFAMPELEGWNPNNYLTTVCVEHAYRGQGVCGTFYNYLLNELPANLHSPITATRTWSQNDGHIRILERLGFSVVKRLTNDRGNGIDTLYFSRRAK